MPKILVENLPVKTYVNAEVEVEDGPEHTPAGADNGRGEGREVEARRR